MGTQMRSRWPRQKRLGSMHNISEAGARVAARAWGEEKQQHGAVGAVTGLHLQGESIQWQKQHREAWFKTTETQMAQAMERQKQEVRAKATGSRG